MNMKSPTQQAIIFLLEEYLKQFDQFEGDPNMVATLEETKARELLKQLNKS